MLARIVGALVSLVRLNSTSHNDLGVLCLQRHFNATEAANSNPWGDVVVSGDMDICVKVLTFLFISILPFPLYSLLS
jgi:hypothetical protein